MTVSVRRLEGNPIVSPIPDSARPGHIRRLRPSPTDQTTGAKLQTHLATLPVRVPVLPEGEHALGGILSRGSHLPHGLTEANRLKHWQCP